MISGIGSSNSYAGYLTPMARGGPSPKEMFNKFDADQSGGISSDELAAWAEDMAAKTGNAIDTSKAFSDYDTDGNGELSAEEMQSFVESTLGPPPSRMPSGGPGSVEDLLSALDTDGSGNVSQDELDAWAAAMTEETGNTLDTTDADANQDGEISSEELSSFLEASGVQNSPPPPPPGGAGPGGNSGDAAEETSSTSAGSVISQYDTDGDGVLSSEELQTYLDENQSSLFKAVIQQSVSAYEMVFKSYGMESMLSMFDQNSSGYSAVDTSA